MIYHELLFQKEKHALGLWGCDVFLRKSEVLVRSDYMCVVSQASSHSVICSVYPAPAFPVDTCVALGGAREWPGGTSEGLFSARRGRCAHRWGSNPRSQGQGRSQR